MFCARVTVMTLTTRVPWLRCVSAGLKIASNWSPWATKNRPGQIEIMTREPVLFFE